MKLQVLAILENGASKLFPRGADILRIHLILRDQEEAVPSSVRSASKTPRTRIRHRVMSDLAAAPDLAAAAA